MTTMVMMVVMMMMMMTLLCCAAQRSHPAWEGLVGCQMAKYKRERCKSHVKKYRFWICINFALDWARTDLAVFIDALAAQNIRPRILCQNMNTLTHNIDIYCQNMNTFRQKMILMMIAENHHMHEKYKKIELIISNISYASGKSNWICG